MLDIFRFIYLMSVLVVGALLSGSPLLTAIALNLLGVN